MDKTRSVTHFFDAGSFFVDRLVDSFGEKWEIRSASKIGGHHFRWWWIADPCDDEQFRKSTFFPDLRATELALTQRIESGIFAESRKYTSRKMPAWYSSGQLPVGRLPDVRGSRRTPKERLVSEPAVSAV